MWGRKSFESTNCQLQRAQNIQNADFEDHLSILLMWFTRIAWVERVKFVEDLLNITKGVNVIGNIINTTRGNVYKECIYIATQCETDNLFDKIIFDDNRTISSATFFEKRKTYLAWFGNLSESRQFEVLMSLFKVAGGALMRMIWFYAVTLRIKRQNNEYHETSSENLLQLVKYAKNSNIIPKASQSKFYMGPLTTVSMKIHREAWEKELKSIKKSMKKSTPVRHPYQSGLIQLITSDSLETLRDLNVNDNSLIATSKKSNSHLIHKKKSELEFVAKNSLDYIQLLPIWINRKIISLLDHKTMKIAKKVNKYWDRLVEAVEAEMKLKIQIEKAVLKQKKKLLNKKNDILLSNTLLEKPKPNKSSDKIIKWQKLHDFDNKALPFGKYISSKICQCAETFRISVDKSLFITNSMKSTTIKIYSLLTAKATHSTLSVVLVQKQITSMLLRENVSRIFLGFENGWLNSYHLWNKKSISRYSGHQSAVICISAATEYVISCSNECVLIHDLKSSFLLTNVLCINANPLLVKNLPDLQYYYVGYSNGQLSKYFNHKTVPSASIIAHSGIITGLEIDDVALVTAGLDHCVRIWDSMLMDDECYFCLEHDSSVTSISIYQKLIVSATNKGYIYVWNMISGTKIRTLTPYTSDFSHNTRIFAYNFFKRSHNIFMILTTSDLEIRIIQFLQYEPKINTDQDSGNKIKQLRATMRSTNIHSRFVFGGVPINLRLDRKVQRLGLTKMRGCADSTLRGNENKEIITKSVPIILKEGILKQNVNNLFTDDEVTTSRDSSYIFPRSSFLNSNIMKLPCKLNRKILKQSPDKRIEKRFDKKTMVQIIHPYKINF